MPWRKRMPRDNGAFLRRVVVSSIPCVCAGAGLYLYTNHFGKPPERGFPRIPANRHPDLPTS